MRFVTNSCLSFFSLLLLCFNLNGENSKPELNQTDSVFVSLNLQNKEILLDEIIVLENKSQKTKTTRSENIEVISSSFLEENIAGNISNTLEKIPGIQSANISPSMARPLIRGFGGYRIVIAKNGQKQEDQSWNNHQGVAINQSSIEEIEIIKGPASLYYGSDAIGGVINISTLSVPDSFGLSGVVGLKAETNNDLLGMNVKIGLREKLFFFNTDVSYQDFADFRVPADSFEYKPNHFAKLDKSMHNTAGKELSFNMQAGLANNGLISYLLFSYFDNKSGFFPYAAGQELVNAYWETHSVSNRDILLPNSQLKDTEVQYVLNKYFKNSKLSSAFGFQQNISKEYDILKDITGNRQDDILEYYDTNLDLGYNLKTISGRINYTYDSQESYSVVIGLNGQSQKNDISGYSHLIPEYKRSMVGLFSEFRYKINQKFAGQLGVRFDYGNISITESINPDPAIGDSILNPQIDNLYPAIVYAAGLICNPGKSFLAKLHIGKSYRMPAAYELASYGIHRHNLRFEKGSCNLNPEEAYQADFVFEYSHKKIQIALYPFLNYFTNYIYLAPTPEFSLWYFYRPDL
ncbi:MAG: TonB-dependent receptor [Bacteroidetes bacterium]|nr:TonB-dependent receptor [Bacteroidota bacterium]MBS4013962.1 TonB-dependent receptor [Bacteroidota bacterium]